MNPIINTVKDAALNFVQTMAGLLVPSGASTALKTKAELAVLGGHQVPDWLKAVKADPAAFLALAGAEGAVPVVRAGVIDGSDQIAFVRFWGSPDMTKPRARGTTIWASTEAGKVFAYFRAWSPEAGKPAPAEITRLNPETGEALGARMVVPEHLACFKFKLDGLGAEYEAAVQAIADYVGLQPGGRKEYVLLAQCNGRHRTECNELGIPTVLNGKEIGLQPIKGFILFEVPKVSGRDDADLASAFAPRPKTADAADVATAQASARVTPVMPVSVSALASAEQL